MSAQIAMQFTPTAETAHAVFGQDVRAEIALHETADGAVMIDLRLQDEAGQGLGLGTLVFDFADHDLLGGLSFEGAQLSGQHFSARGVHAGAQDARGFDCGARFGRGRAMTAAAPRAAAAKLAHDSLAITLDDLAGRAFALHLVPTAANHAPCEGFVIEGRLPDRPASGPAGAAPADGSIFGGLFAEIAPMLSNRAVNRAA